MRDKANIPDSNWLRKAQFIKEDSDITASDNDTILMKAVKKFTTRPPRPINIPLPARESDTDIILQRVHSPIQPNESNQGSQTEISSPPIQAEILDTSEQKTQLPPSGAPIEQPLTIPAVTTRSGRSVKPTTRKLESQQQRQQGVVAYHVEFEAIDPHLYREEDILAALDDPIAFNASCHIPEPVSFKATNNPDTFYMHDVLKQPDAAEFKKAMVKEVQDQTNRKHWKVVEKRSVPKGETILPAFSTPYCHS
jgi:hypothetical protein